jgi:AmmeMemoRadiSam system protein B
MSGGIRPPAVAGQFYEKSAERLRNDIKVMTGKALSSAKCVERDNVRAMILPHAGYVYSGQTAVNTICTARENRYSRILALAPTHRVYLEGLAASSYSAYETPLGEIQLDKEGTGKLLAASSYIQEMDQAHANEHSLEVETPLFQSFFLRYKLLPLICGKVNANMANELAGAMSDFWEKDTLWAISSDFTHYGQNFNYTPFTDNVPENLSKLDFGAIEKILELDLEGFQAYLAKTKATICGANPISVLLAAINKAQENGEKIKAELIEYTNSGKLTGDYSHCVSYAGIIFCNE